MPTPIIEIDDHGLLGRMSSFPQQVKKDMPKGMEDSLNILNENVPKYPPKPPGSKYIRTENLGKSMGSGFAGGKIGRPDIFIVRKIGEGYEGRFGSRIAYAEFVIGEGTQADVHHGRWWTVKTIAEKSLSKMVKLWNELAGKWAKFLDGKGK